MCFVKAVESNNHKVSEKKMYEKNRRTLQYAVFPATPESLFGVFGFLFFVLEGFIGKGIANER